MGVSLGPTGTRGAKRPVDAELNLIPFIDLLSVSILFLLMTAVWVDISKMSAFSQAGGETTVQHSDVSSPTQQRETRDWDVLVTRQGIEVVQDRRSLGRFSPEEFPEAVVGLKSRLSNAEEAEISLRAADNVLYQDVIIALDGLFTAELFNVSIGGLN